MAVPKNENQEESKLNITLAGEVYYFTVATFVTIFIICSMLSNGINIVAAILMISALWILPFAVITIINLIKFSLMSKMAKNYGKKE